MSRESVVEKLGERHEGVDYFYTTCHNNGCWDATCLIKCSVKDGEIIGYHLALVDGFSIEDESSDLNEEQSEQLLAIYRQLILSVTD